MASAQADVWPSPVFEGSEKRLEVDFTTCSHSGLRSISREQLDQLMTDAGCCIVSDRHNDQFDAYVLSESSLFVFPHKLVLKTCGTTKILHAIPMLLGLAASAGCILKRCKYSRASFLYPQFQPEVYQNFEHEVSYLRQHFGSLGHGGDAYILGDPSNGLQWHVYVADADTRTPCPSAAPPAEAAAVIRLTPTAAPATYSLEVCMTELCQERAVQFFRSEHFVSAQHTSTSSGIQALLPKAQIDDYVFEPCGYSMNGMEGSGFSTIHITPEDGFSYASFEASNYATQDLDIDTLVTALVQIFNPGKLTVALTVDTNLPCCIWGEAVCIPDDYTCHASCKQSFSCGGRTSFYSLAKQTKAPLVVSEPVSPLAVAESGKAAFMVSEPASPHHSKKGAHMTPEAVMPRAVDRDEAPGLVSEPVSPQAGADRPASMMSMSYQSDFDRLSNSDTAASGDDARPKDASPGEGAAMQTSPPDPTGSNRMSVMSVLQCFNATMLDVGNDAEYDAFINKVVQEQSLEDPLYVVDLGALARLYQAWVKLMPRVTPYYAVKCNTDPAMVSLLAALGAGFDCASEWEADTVLGLGVPANRIVFANACKRPCDIRYAAAKGLDLTTFDTESELHKLARWHRGTSALLRIRADDAQARCQLGNKYGALQEECAGLLETAQQLGIRVVGIAFHVGSGATNPQAFADAIAAARLAFDQGSKLGFDMHLLDIGGGFAGGSFNPQGVVQLGGVPDAVNAALALHFPEPNVKIIAEPGRYFAESCCTFACMVFGIRSQRLLDGQQGYDYWITDGLYGSMNSVMYDHATLTTRPLVSTAAAELFAEESTVQELYKSTVFGPTCDGLDTVLSDYSLPKLRNGDWLVFPKMGAYTLSGASNFNGIQSTDIKMCYVWSERSS